MARGHFHERVGETPVHWLPPGVVPQKPFSVSENEPFENFLRSNSIFKAHISYQSVQWRLTAVLIRYNLFEHSQSLKELVGANCALPAPLPLISMFERGGRPGCHFLETISWEVKRIY